MKKGILSLILALFLSFTFAPKAKAFSSTGLSYDVFFSQTNVAVNAYTQVNASLPKNVIGFTYFSTSQNPVTIAAGAAGQEVDQFTVPPGTLPGAAYNGSPNGQYTAISHFVPLQFAATRRLAIKCRNSQCLTGELQLNFIYGN